MIATAAESNPSCFSPTPLVDLEKTLIPHYVRLVSIMVYIPPWYLVDGVKVQVPR